MSIDGANVPISVRLMHGEKGNAWGSCPLHTLRNTRKVVKHYRLSQWVQVL